ncbi:MAG: response regulator transcription factor [Sulfurimonas sp.]
MYILLMEDDPVLADIVVDFLSESYHVDHAYNSDEVHSLLEQQNYDLFLFDINVTGQNGLDLLQDLRDFSNTTPTIFITAYKDTKHLTKAFEIGAHDYIKKPFELDELQARILNIKRIFNIDQNIPTELSKGVFFDPESKIVISDDQELSLGQKNTLLLNYFLKNQNRVISNEELIQNIWNFESLPSEATLRSHIRDIRNIIGKERIKTVRGEGYIYE